MCFHKVSDFQLYSTCKCGLVVSVTNPWLGASPDGLVHDPTSHPPDGLVEFKNPYTAKEMTLDEAVSKVKVFVFAMVVLSSFNLKRQARLLSDTACHVLHKSQVV